MIPRSAYDVIVATVGDYERMKKALETGIIAKEQIALYTNRVATIDNAICAVCDGEPYEAGRALLRDIAHRRGFERSEAKNFYPSIGTFEKRKREAIRLIGRMLNII